MTRAPERSGVDQAAAAAVGPSSAAVEREVKLDATPSYRIPSLRGLPSVAEIVSLPPESLEATYVDTSELHLARNGITFRHRTERQGAFDRQLWTLKLPAQADGVTLSRRELVWAGGLEEPPAEAARMLRSTTFGVPLEPVGRLDTKRRRTELRDANGAALVEISDDRVSLRSDGKRLRRFREIEVELVPDAPVELATAVVERLRAAGATESDSHPKVFRALGPAALEPPPVVVPELGRKASVAEMVSASIGKALTTLVHHEPGLRLDGDVEHVHKARVATRRLRTDLRTFRRVLDGSWVQRTRRELKWLGGALGAVRDADVLLARLRSQAAELGISTDPGARILDQIGLQRLAARAQLLEALDGDRYLRLLTTLRDAALDPRVAGVKGGKRARSLVPALVRGSWRRVRKEVAGLPKHPGDPQLHEVRKKAKALRYASEAAVPIAGRPAKRLASRAEAVQDVLGELQDAVVARRWLEEHGRSVEASQALVAGQLIEHQRVCRGRSRSRWAAAWHRLDRGKVRAWLS